MDLIGEFSGFAVKNDPQKRVGNMEFKNSHAEWMRLSRGGRHQMSNEDHARDNEKTGSSFYTPIWNFQSKKQNNGIMHTPAGHTNHYWVEVSSEIRNKLKDCLWQVCLRTIELEVTVFRRKVEVNFKTLQSCSASKALKVQLRWVRKELKKADAAVEKDQGLFQILRNEEEEVREDLRLLSDTTDVESLNLILNGCK